MQRLFHCAFFFGARAGKDEIGNGLAKVPLARMPDTQTQPPEIRGGKRRLNVLQSVVPTIAATFFKTDSARWKIKIVMHNKNSLRENFIKARESANRLPGTIHESHGLQKPKLSLASKSGKKTSLGREGNAELLSKAVKKTKAYIMPGSFVFRTRIAQTYNQTGGDRLAHSENSAKISDRHSCLSFKTNKEGVCISSLVATVETPAKAGVPTFAPP